MEAKVKKWGNSLGVRIPKSFSAQAGINDGSDIELQLEGNKIPIVPIHKNEYNLDELLSKVSDDNIHYEIKTNGSVGNEVWLKSATRSPKEAMWFDSILNRKRDVNKVADDQLFLNPNKKPPLTQRRLS